ncbi:MAG: hypothetical protein ACI9KE_004932 [Polyangiales bacterium]|jgi:hypothetical protein
MGAPTHLRLGFETSRRMPSTASVGLSPRRSCGACDSEPSAFLPHRVSSGRTRPQPQLRARPKLRAQKPRWCVRSNALGQNPPPRTLSRRHVCRPGKVGPDQHFRPRKWSGTLSGHGPSTSSLTPDTSPNQVTFVGGPTVTCTGLPRTDTSNPRAESSTLRIAPRAIPLPSSGVI